ncbi:hypothetical protein D3C72_2165220 [compost metagenome]
MLLKADHLLRYVVLHLAIGQQLAAEALARLRLHHQQQVGGIGIGRMGEILLQRLAALQHATQAFR